MAPPLLALLEVCDLLNSPNCIIGLGSFTHALYSGGCSAKLNRTHIENHILPAQQDARIGLYYSGTHVFHYDSTRLSIINTYTVGLTVRRYSPEIVSLQVNTGRKKPKILSSRIHKVIMTPFAITSYIVNVADSML